MAMIGKPRARRDLDNLGCGRTMGRSCARPASETHMYMSNDPAGVFAQVLIKDLALSASLRLNDLKGSTTTFWMSASCETKRDEHA
jgi:hypothetical protein